MKPKQAVICNIIRDRLLELTRMDSPAALCHAANIAHKTADHFLSGRIPSHNSLKKVVDGLGFDAARRALIWRHWIAVDCDVELDSVPTEEGSANPGLQLRRQKYQKLGLDEGDVPLTDPDYQQAVACLFARDVSTDVSASVQECKKVYGAMTSVYRAKFYGNDTESIYLHLADMNCYEFQWFEPITDTALLSEWHVHQCDYQFSKCFHGHARILVREPYRATPKNEDADHDYCFDLYDGCEVVIPPKYYHRVEAHAPNTKYFVLGFQEKDDLLDAYKDRLLRLLSVRGDSEGQCTKGKCA